jgi:amino acid adenylation domain-containing protein
MTLDGRTLQQLFAAAVVAHPTRLAVEDAAGRSLTYGELDALTDPIRDALVAAGAGPGQRVGMCLAKSLDSVAALIGILKTGAAYVPLDVTSPMSRAAYVLHNCGIAVAFVEKQLESSLAAELASLGHSVRLVPVTRTPDRPHHIAESLTELTAPPRVAATHAGDPDDLAYVLYTSGSTGRPKGVALTHENALSYVRWCAAILKPAADDRFSSHAPFHFDLSILDLYTPWTQGAALVLIDEQTAKEPMSLAKLVAERRISIWYSTPTILSAMVQAGRMDKYDYGSLKTVIFAGEVFPVVHLRRLVKLLPASVHYLNLYGPTETNVCTWYEVPRAIPEDRTDPYPIGKVCAHYEGRVIVDGGAVARRGERGELVVRGPAVMKGYWGMPEQTERAFHVDAGGGRWYRTGDIVWEDDAGDYVFAGRADRMVKKRGYRIELGEIESCLYTSPTVKEAAVIADADPDHGTRIHAFVSVKDVADASVIAFKKYCSERLPLYMVPDFFVFLDELPHTSTDKIDLQKLRHIKPSPAPR